MNNKYKKKVRFTLSFLLAAFLGFGMVSCGENNNPTSNQLSQESISENFSSSEESSFVSSESSEESSNEETSEEESNELPPSSEVTSEDATSEEISSEEVTSEESSSEEVSEEESSELPPSSKVTSENATSEEVTSEESSSEYTSEEESSELPPSSEVTSENATSEEISSEEVTSEESSNEETSEEESSELPPSSEVTSEESSSEYTSEEESSEHIHAYEEEILVEPTCEKKGYTKYTCHYGDIYVETIPELGHDLTYHSAIAPSCTTPGCNDYESCTRCDYTTLETVPALGHNEVKIPQVDPKCTSVGYTELIYCFDCGEKIVDKEEIPAVGHSYEEEVIAPTCEEEGYTIYTCHCGDTYKSNFVDSLGHLEVIDNSIDATCEETGLTEGKHCARCNSVFIAQETIDALGHKKTVEITETTINYSVLNSTSYPFSISENKLTSTNHDDDSSATFTITAQNNFILNLEYKVSSESTYDKFTISVNNVTKISASGTSTTIFKSWSINLNKNDVVKLTYSKDDSGDEGQDCVFINILTEPSITIVEEHTLILTPELINQYVTCVDDVTCDVCSKVLKEKLGHDLTHYDSKEATCVEKGHNEYFACSRCSYSTIVEEEILPHNVSDGACTYCGCKESSNGMLYSLNEDGVTYTLTSVGECKDSRIIVGIYNNRYVTNIADSAFKGCKTIRSIELESCVKTIGIQSFYQCNNLVEVINHTDIDITTKSSLYGYVGYYALEIHNGDSKLNILNDYIFYSFESKHYLLGYIGSDTELVLPINYLGDNYIIYNNAFSNMDITSVIIPSAVTYIDYNAFYGCTLLNTLYIEDIESWCNIEFAYNTSVEDEGTYYSSNANPMYYAKNIYIGNELITELSIPEGITKINNFAFHHGNFTSVILPSSLEEIGIGAFAESKIYDLILPEGLKTIESEAFAKCSQLNTVTVPTTLERIKERAFEDCTKLKGVYISNLTNWCDISFYYDDDHDEGYWQDCDANPLKYARDLYLNGELIIDLVIPEDVISLGNYAFHGGSFRSAKLNNNISSIPSGTFRNCSNLTYIEIPHNVKSFGHYAFNGCYSLNILVASGVTSIGDWAFWSAQLKTIYFGTSKPSGMSSDGNYFFEEDIRYGNICVSIDGISYSLSNGKASVINCNKYLSGSLIVPETVEYNGEQYIVNRINTYAFYKCDDIISIELPSSITYLESSAFYECKNLFEVITTNIELGEQIYGNVIEVHSGNSKLIEVDDYLFYNLDGTNYLLKYFGDENYLSLPLDYNGGSYKIYNYAFYNNSLISVEIPNSVLSIGDYAFAGCENLDEVDIPSSVTNIGENAFAGCVSLKSITLNNGLETIGYYAFSGTAINSIIIPDSVISIGTYTFANCTSLETIVFGNSLSSIPNYAFENCISLFTITIPETITSINLYAFNKCVNIVEVINKSALDVSKIFTTAKNIVSDESESTIEYINNYIFVSNSSETYLVGYLGNDTDLVLPEYKTSYIIGESVFEKNQTITSVKLSNSTKEIKKKAFASCSSLISIIIPSSVEIIGSSAFASCSSLTDVVLNEGLMYIDNYAFEYCRSLTSIVIPSSVKTIGSNVFGSCSALTKITLPFIGSKEDGSGSTYLGYLFGATSYNTNKTYVPTSLKEVVLTGDSKIPNYAFYNCVGLSSISVIGNVENIGSSAFNGCTGLTNIVLPSTLTSISSSVFSNCNNLKNVYYNGTIQNWCNINFGSYDSTPMYFAENIYLKNNNGTVSYEGIKYNLVTQLNIPNSITSINDYTFYGFSKITSISIPNSVTSIGMYAFRECASLTSIVIPKSVISVGSYAFYNCNSLTKITIPFVGANADGKGATHFGYLFGAGTYSLNNSYLPQSLKEVVITGGTAIANNAFYKCQYLTKVSISTNTITTIGDSAFYECKNLESITFNSGLTKIGTIAFSNCSSLQSVVLSETITSIGVSAFNNCSNLKVVYNNSDIVVKKGYSGNGYVGKYADNVYNKGEWSYQNGVPTPNL